MSRRLTRATPLTALARREPGTPPPTIGTRRASIAASSYDPTARTVDAVLSAGSPVRRYFGTEELVMTADAVDLSRAAAGLVPLLNAHNQGDVGAVLGAVDNVRLEGARLLGRFRFADTPAGRDAEGMVARGELTGISIGYAVRTWQLAETADDTGDLWRAASWQLLEVSLVPVPADPAAGFRAHPHSGGNGAADDEGDDDVLTRNNPGGGGAPAAPSAAPPTPAADAITSRSIATAARNAGLTDSAALEIVHRHEADPFTRETLMAEIGQRFAARDSGARTINRVSPMAIGAHTPALRERMEGALFARMSGTAPADGARELMGLSLAGMARALGEERGEHNRWESDMTVIERAMHTTSDFPQLLQGAGNRYLVTVFEAAGSAIKNVARERTARDFRDIANIQLSGGGVLSKVNEGGEIRYGTFAEGGERYRLATFAKIFALSRQAIVNDDLGAFADPLRLMARAAAETEASELAGLLNANNGLGPIMSDNKTLFHADHGNLAPAGAALAIGTLSDGRVGMRGQKDADGSTPLNAVPRHLLVGKELETTVEQVLTALAAAKVGDVNPFPGKLELQVDPRLAAAPFRLFADPAQFPVLEYAYLNQAQGPQLTSREGWNVLGTEFRVVLDFGCGAIDPRGAWMNKGA